MKHTKNTVGAISLGVLALISAVGASHYHLTKTKVNKTEFAPVVQTVSTHTKVLNTLTEENDKLHEYLLAREPVEQQTLPAPKRRIWE